MCRSVLSHAKRGLQKLSEIEQQPYLQLAEGQLLENLSRMEHSPTFAFVCYSKAQNHKLAYGLTNTITSARRLRRGTHCSLTANLFGVLQYAFSQILQLVLSVLRDRIGGAQKLLERRRDSGVS